MHSLSSLRTEKCIIMQVFKKEDLLTLKDMGGGWNPPIG
jgi:hypothetical protein